MSVEIWPPVAPEQLKAALETTQKRELDWLLDDLHDTLKTLKHGLEDCYALLAPTEPGSTLVLSTPRNEIVKGHVTRVGTRIVKGMIHLRLRTFPHQTLTINPDHPIHLGPLTSLNSLLTHSIDLLGLTLSYFYGDTTELAVSPPGADPPIHSPQFLAAQLRLLAQSLAESISLLKGPPLTSGDPSWATRSVAPSHFTPPLPTSAPPHGMGLNITGGSSSGGSSTSSGKPDGQVAPPLSFHLGIQESSLVLWLRTLEPAAAPVNFGTKLALAIGTARRLEHDEADKVFGFCVGGDDADLDEQDKRRGGSLASARKDSMGGGANKAGSGSTSQQPASKPQPIPLSGTRASTAPPATKREVDVFVREKVRIESADPSLLSLAAKLVALSHTLGLARRNLAAVMGEDLASIDD